MPSSSCWSSDLPDELLSSILNLLSPPDYARAGAVCKRWNSVAKERFLLPWLLLPSTEADQAQGLINFYSFPLQRQLPPIKLDLPFRCSRCIKASGRWLIVADEFGELHLLNPLTGAHFSLPPLSTLPKAKFMFYDDFRFGSGDVTWSDNSPSTYTVMAAYGLACCWSLAFARQGDSAWTRLEMEGYYKPMQALLYFKGRFMAEAFDSEANLHQLIACDLSGPQPVVTAVAGLDGLFHYQLKFSGDLYHVIRNTERDPTRTYLHITRGFQVYKLVHVDGHGNNGGQEDKWVKVESLGDHSFFVGYRNSFALLARDNPGVKANCIYGYKVYRQRFQASVFDLEDRSITYYDPDQAPQTDMLPPTWFSPDL